jgi:hypothetical protein
MYSIYRAVAAIKTRSIEGAFAFELAYALYRAKEVPNALEMLFTSLYFGVPSFPYHTSDTNHTSHTVFTVLTKWCG